MENVVPEVNENTQVSSEDSRKMALIAAEAADSKKATDITVQEVGPIIGVADYFVIASVSNPNQSNAVLEEIEDKLREEVGAKPDHREKSADGSWSLLDYGNIVVHVFLKDAREYYRLEELFNDAPIIDLIAEAGFTNPEYSERIQKLFSLQ